jgi:hypothetical protein
MKLLDLRISALSIVCFSLGGPLFSQQTSGNLVGTIYDSTAATVPGVQVTGHDDATGIDVNIPRRQPANTASITFSGVSGKQSECALHHSGFRRFGRKRTEYPAAQSDQQY